MARVAISNDYYGTGFGTTDYYGSQAHSRFIKAIYSKKVLRNFYASAVYPQICNTDADREIKNEGDTVYFRKTPAISVNTYSVGQDITYEVPNEDAIELVIDKALYSAFRVDDIDKAQSDLNLINMFANDVSFRLKITVDQDMLQYMSGQADAANAGATAGALSGNIDLGAAGAPVVITGGSTGNAVNKIVDVGQALDENDQEQMGRWMVLPAWYVAQLKTGDLKRADVTGDGTGVIRTGLIGQVDNFTIYQNNNLYHVTDGVTGNEAFYVLAGRNEATTFAAQITKQDSLPIPNSFGQYWRTLFVYGRKVVQPQALAVMYCERG